MKSPEVRETTAGWRLGHRQSDAQHRIFLMISEAALSQGGSGHLALRSPPEALTACTGAAMSRWTQTPGQSNPMCAATKRPAQELGLLSRS